MKIYAKSNVKPYDVQGLKSAVNRLLSEAAKRGGYSSYVLKSAVVKKYTRPTQYAVELEYAFEGETNAFDNSGTIGLEVPVRVDIPEDYYLSDITISTVLSNAHRFSDKEVSDNQVWSEEVFKRFTKAANQVARKLNVEISEPRRYPPKPLEGESEYTGKLTLYFDVVNVPSNYKITYTPDLYWMLRVWDSNAYIDVRKTHYSLELEFKEPEPSFQEGIESFIRKVISNVREAENVFDTRDDYYDRLSYIETNIQNKLSKYEGFSIEVKDNTQKWRDEVKISIAPWAEIELYKNGESVYSTEIDDIYTQDLAKLWRRIQSGIRRNSGESRYKESTFDLLSDDSNNDELVTL